MFKPVIAGLAALTTLALVSQTQAAITVLGGGMAQACSLAAIAGETELKYEKLCTEALELELLSPKDRAGTYVNRGVLKLRRAQFAAATSDFDRAVRMKPDMGEAYVNRGAASIGARRYADSLADINRGLELGLAEPEKAYFNRALAYEALDDMKAAYFDYQKAVELKPLWAAPQEQLTRFKVSRQ